MTIEKDLLSNLSSIDEQDDDDDYKRNHSIQIGFEQELKSLSVRHGDSARFEAKISSCKSIDRSFLQIEWRVNDIRIVNDPKNLKYQFGCSTEENRYWMDIQHCQQQDEKVYTIYISYDDGRLHDESSAYLFVEKDQSMETETIVSLNECAPPTIIRSLQPAYRYQPGEQLHFLVEYQSCTGQCHCAWQVQYINDIMAQSIGNGLIVNADCSSILIIESITSELQGLYTFHVENMYGRAMTQTSVIVNTNDSDEDKQKYQDIEEYRHRHSNGLHHLSSNPSIEYEDVRGQSSKEDMIYYSSMNGKQSYEEDLDDLSLYSQRHIAYFDPSLKFDHVQSIEQLESEDISSSNGHRMQNGHGSKIRIQFELPPPPPIEDILEEHIYEDIPTIVSIPQNSLSTSVQEEQSAEIADNSHSITGPMPRSPSSPNSLDEVLNHVEQWSDTIVDSDTLEPLSPRQILKISPLNPSFNEYVDEEYINHRSDVSIEEFNDSKRNRMLIDPTDECEDSEVLESEIIDDEESFSESYTDRMTSTEPDDDDTPASIYHLNDMDQVIETIHVDDELFEAKKTCIIGIQAPHEGLLSLTQSDNESTTQLISRNSLSTEEMLSSDQLEEEFPILNEQKMEESLEIVSNKIIGYIDIPPSQISSDDQKPEVIIVTTEEISPIHSSDYLPVSNVKIESAQTILSEQTPIISLTIIHEKVPGELLESLSVPVQPDLLPLATMPDQTMNTDERRVPDRTVQDVLSASLEPMKMNHSEGAGDIIPIIAFASTEKVKDHEEFFDMEAEYILSPEKPLITLAEAEKLQHDAAIEQKDENFIDTELNLASKTMPTILDLFSTSSIAANEIKEELIDKIESLCSQQEWLRPKFSLRLKPTVTINDGDNLKLEVHFLGHPVPKVAWYFKSDPLKPSSNVHILQSDDVQTFCSILSMEKINRDYEGKFKVMIKNELGDAISVSQVNIKRALIAVQLHTPTKKTNVGKTSTLLLANE